MIQISPTPVPERHIHHNQYHHHYQQFDLQAYAQDFALLLREMSDRYRQGLSPQPIEFPGHASRPE